MCQSHLLWSRLAANWTIMVIVHQPSSTYGDKEVSHTQPANFNFARIRHTCQLLLLQRLDACTCVIGLPASTDAFRSPAWPSRRRRGWRTHFCFMNEPKTRNRMVSGDNLTHAPNACKLTEWYYRMLLARHSDVCLSFSSFIGKWKLRIISSVISLGRLFNWKPKGPRSSRPHEIGLC